MTRKQRVRLASEVPAPPPGMSAFADLFEETPATPGIRPPLRHYAELSAYRYCDLFPFSCRSLSDHAAHPGPLELARSSTDTQVLRTLVKDPSPAVLEALVSRSDLPSAVLCRALLSGSRSVPPIVLEGIVLRTLERPNLSRQLLEAVALLSPSGEALLCLCEHPRSDDRLRAYVGACVAVPRISRSPSDREDCRYVVRSSTGLWGRAAWALVTASPTLSPEAAVRRSRPIARSASGEVVVETLEVLAPEWHGTLDELCRTAGLLS